MLPQGLFGRSQRMERSKVKRAQLNEKAFWRQTLPPATPRCKRIPALHSAEDLKVRNCSDSRLLSWNALQHTLSCCVLWITLNLERPELNLSYKYATLSRRQSAGIRLFDRWIHKPVSIVVENWKCRQDEADDEVRVCLRDVLRGGCRTK